MPALYCIFATLKWRGVRVVEGARLESVYTRKGIAGSNPALSASLIIAPAAKLRVFRLEQTVELDRYGCEVGMSELRSSNPKNAT